MPLRQNGSKGLMHSTMALLPDFWDCNRRLWKDKLGQISLSTTTLFWGVSGNLRYIVLAWAAVALAMAPRRLPRWWGSSPLVRP